MTPYYLIADVRIDDMDAYKNYMEQAKPLVERYGGVYLVRGGDFKVLEGDYFSPRRMVLIRFPDKQSCERFYNDPAYQQARAIRLPVSDMVLIGIEGFEA
ncbi:MAG: DUF1330 domain-containing protein [Rhodospirillaceae bacterium]|nr:DUF1330 domain-containing protein [Rhodospirillaceae bacterium]MBL6930048.1 DUF1330 domain-containing protein [Rhodospirillales bacterium]MBL6941967.1 DUF1330 domain-containing protein [Rhodospirillales bacterium]